MIILVLPRALQLLVDGSEDLNFSDIILSMFIYTWYSITGTSERSRLQHEKNMTKTFTK